jgi:DNA-binding PadR family transcriptional regulator
MVKDSQEVPLFMRTTTYNDVLYALGYQPLNSTEIQKKVSESTGMKNVSKVSIDLFLMQLEGEGCVVGRVDEPSKPMLYTLSSIGLQKQRELKAKDKKGYQYAQKSFASR